MRRLRFFRRSVYSSAATCALLLHVGCASSSKQWGPPGPIALSATPQPKAPATRQEMGAGSFDYSGDNVTGNESVSTAASAALVYDTDSRAPQIEVASAVSFIEPSAIDTEVLSLSLQSLEAIALTNNPAIKELAATTQKAAGYRLQVGLKANPFVGYQGQQLADEGTDQHLVFAEQEFVTGDKLQLNRQVQNEALRAQLFELEAQRLRVVTDIRANFYAALALQKQIELIGNFQEVSQKGVKLAELRKQAAEGTQIDILQAKIQNSEVDLSLQQAMVQYNGYLRELAALAGVATLPAGRLEGDFQSAQSIDFEKVVNSLVQSSPEYIAAQSRISQAQAALRRQNVQAIPNLGVQFGAGIDNGTNSGMMNVQVGAPIPIHNKNQGNISAAHAELCRAVMEAERIEKAIQARFAAVSRDYASASVAVETYQTQILPSAKESLDLAEQAYTAGETSFLQVLVARRTFFDSNLQFIKAQSELAIAQAKIDGYVLSGGLDPVFDGSGDSSLRDQTFSQQ